MKKKAVLTITDIMGSVSSNSSSEERDEINAASVEEANTSVSTLERPHKMVQGNPDFTVLSEPVEENPRDNDALESLLDEQEPPHDDVIRGILGLGQDVVKDVPTSSAQAHKDMTDKGQDVGEAVLAYL